MGQHFKAPILIWQEVCLIQIMFTAVVISLIYWGFMNQICFCSPTAPLKAKLLCVSQWTQAPPCPVAICGCIWVKHCLYSLFFCCLFFANKPSVSLLNDHLYFKDRKGPIVRPHHHLNLLIYSPLTHWCCLFVATRKDPVMDDWQLVFMTLLRMRGTKGRKMCPYCVRLGPVGEVTAIISLSLFLCFVSSQPLLVANL